LSGPSGGTPPPGPPPPPGPRVLGVDLGTRRIGLALSDPLGITAGPLAVIERSESGDRAADHRAILEAAREAGATQIVVGLPLSLSTGAAGPAARAVLEEVDELSWRAALEGVAVETHDERLSTVSARSALAAGGVKARDRRGRLDEVAAAVILQSWLDGQRGR